MKSRPHEEFLRHYQPVHEALVRYCSSHAFGIVDAGDLVQETVLATMKKFHSIQDRNKLLPYMIAVANNIVKGLMRRRKFNGEISESAWRNLESRVPDPDRRHDIRYLYEVLGTLPLHEKEAVILFEISGFSMREIGDIQGVTEGAVRVRVHRARQKLREAFAAEGAAVVAPRGGSLLSLLL